MPRTCSQSLKKRVYNLFVPTINPNDIPGSLHSLVTFFTHIGTDFFAFIIVAAAVAAFAFYMGRDRLMPLIAGLYAAIPLWQHFPYGATILSDPLTSIGLYVGLTLAGTVAFAGLSAFVAGNSIGFIKLIILSALTAGMIIAVAIHILPVSHFYTFSAPIAALFASPQSFFLWLVAPLAGIFFFGRG